MTEIHRIASFYATRKALTGLLCVLFLIAQTVDLAHSHDGDFRGEFDCEVCLNAASDDDDSLLAGFELHSGKVTIRPNGLAVSEYLVHTISPQSRAPPLV